MLRRFNFIQLVLYPMIGAGGVIGLSIWLANLIHIDWLILQENPFYVNILSTILVIGIIFFLGLIFYCIAQLFQIIQKAMTFQEWDEAIKKIKES